MTDPTAGRATNWSGELQWSLEEDLATVGRRGGPGRGNRSLVSPERPHLNGVPVGDRFVGVVPGHRPGSER